METAIITINHQGGVHTRPASIFVKEAAKYHSEVTLECDGTSVNGKSIMGLLMLAMGPGSVVTIKTSGADEVDALKRLSEVLSGNFQ